MHTVLYNLSWQTAWGICDYFGLQPSSLGGLETGHPYLHIVTVARMNRRLLHQIEGLCRAGARVRVRQWMNTCLIVVAAAFTLTCRRGVSVPALQCLQRLTLPMCQWNCVGEVGRHTG